MPAVLGYGTGLAVILSTFDFCGHALTGYNKDPTVDDFERKQFLRKNFRKPAEQTIAEIGEGRGMQSGCDEAARRIADARQDSTLPATKTEGGRGLRKSMAMRSRHRPRTERRERCEFVNECYIGDSGCRASSADGMARYNIITASTACSKTRAKIPPAASGPHVKMRFLFVKS